jgi:hypothetical protein
MSWTSLLYNGPFLLDALLVRFALHIGPIFSEGSRFHFFSKSDA